MSDPSLEDIQHRLARLEERAENIERVAREVLSRVDGPLATPVGEGRLLLHTMHSLMMYVDAADVIITPRLIVYRQWEPELTSLLWNSCRGDTVFVDVGANIGYFSLLVGAKIHAGGSGRVIAVEPNPACYELMERSLAINWSLCDIQLHKVALAGESGEVWFALPPNKAANAHILAEGDEDGDKIRVPVTTLDSLIPDGLAVDILKIDVEGYELGVMEGADRVIAQSPNIRIITEWSSQQMHRAGVSQQAFQDKVKSLGLVARRLPSSGNLDDVTEENSPMIPFEDLANLSYDNILLTRA